MVNFVWQSATDNLSGVEYYEFTNASDSLFMQDSVSVNVFDTSIYVLFSSGTYYWKVRAVDRAGNEGAWSDVYKFSVGVSVKEKEKTPVKYEIKNVAMKGKALIIRYGLPKASEVTLKLYDLSGRVVKRINQHSGSGYHEVSIPVSILHRGVYFVEMKAGEYRGIKKVLLFR